MSTLSNLKLTNAIKPTQIPAIQHRRNKLSNKIWEQMQLAEAQKLGETFTSNRLKSVTTLDGVKKTVEVQKRVRPWWFTNEQGKVCLSIRYGSKIIQLAKDKTAVELTNKDDLIKTFEVIKLAIEAGELDKEIDEASNNLRAGFKR